ncbi:MAG: hypothetical protein ACK53Y_16030 [bacterium]
MMETFKRTTVSVGCPTDAPSPSEIRAVRWKNKGKADGCEITNPSYRTALCHEGFV